MAKILVIDDYPPILDILRILLPVEGHEVSTAPDGPAGLRLAGNAPFDLALIDVDMPGLDGISVCKSLKSNPATRNMRVVMMTGRPGLEVEARSRLAGALVVIAKPFLGRELMDVIARLDDMTAACAGGGRGHGRGKESRARRTLT